MGVIQQRGRFGAKLMLDARQVWIGTFPTRAAAQEAIDATRSAYRAGELDLATRILFWPTRSTARNYREALRRDPCAYCGERGGWLDHIHARARGGADDFSNLAGTCRGCNARKADRALLRHLLARSIRADLEVLKEKLRAVEPRGDHPTGREIP